MKTIFVAHSRDFDYKNFLYKKILDSEIAKRYKIILPHEEDEVVADTKVIIQDCDYVIAEISNKSTGVGIELGWANAFGKDITCLHVEWVPIHAYMQQLTKKFIPYESYEDMISKLEDKFLFKWEKFGEMNKELYNSGETIGMLDGKSEWVQSIVERLSYECGAFCDWHYAAGRAIIKTSLEKADIANRTLISILCEDGRSRGN